MQSRQSYQPFVMAEVKMSGPMSVWVVKKQKDFEERLFCVLGVNHDLDLAPEKNTGISQYCTNS